MFAPSAPPTYCRDVGGVRSLVMDDAPLEIALFGAVMAAGRRDSALQPTLRAPHHWGIGIVVELNEGQLRVKSLKQLREPVS